MNEKNWGLNYCKKKKKTFKAADIRRKMATGM